MATPLDQTPITPEELAARALRAKKQPKKGASSGPEMQARAYDMGKQQINQAIKKVPEKIAKEAAAPKGLKSSKLKGSALLALAGAAAGALANSAVKPNPLYENPIQ